MGAKDDLARILADAINDSSNEGKIAYFLDDDEAPTNVSQWVSTGQSMLDLAISNRPHGGFPSGKIIEITGLEQSGKSLLAAHALAETQKKGGVSVLIDTENSVNKAFYEAIGLDISKLVYIQVNTVERIFESIEKIIERVKSLEKTKSKSNKGRIVTIVVDSLAGASHKKELEGDYDQTGWATQKAIIISQALRKITNTIGRENILLIFTNQLRVKMNAMFGDPYTTSGGKALQFHSSVMIRLKKLSLITKGTDVIGVKVRATVTKNRIGPPHRHADFDIYYDRGIDNYGSWLQVLKENKIVEQRGSWYAYGDKKFQSKDFSKILDDKNLKEELYQKICDAVILKYKSHSVNTSEDVDPEIEKNE